MIAHSWVARCILATFLEVFVEHSKLFDDVISTINMILFDSLSLVENTLSLSRVGGMVSSSGSAPDKGGSIPSPATIALGEK